MEKAWWGSRAAAVVPASSFTALKDAIFLPDPEIPKPFLLQGIHSILPSNMTRKKYRVHKVSRTDKVGKVKFLKKGTV